MSRDDRIFQKELEKVIREQKAHSIFFNQNSSAYNLDVNYLLEYISKKHPEIAEKFAANFVDTTQMKDCSKQDILSFMARTEKDTICKWKDEAGEEHYFINNGKNLLGTKTNIIAFSSRLNKKDLENLQKTMLKKALENNIKKVYERIEKEQQVKIRKTKKSFFDILEERKTEKLESYASDFEKNFKTLVRQQGGTANSIQLAQSMVAFMDDREVKQLNSSLSSQGIRDGKSFEQLLAQWKNEALNLQYELEKKIERKKTKSQTIEVLRSR